MVLRLYLILPTIVVGLLGNAVNVVVFAQPAMRASPTNWFLLVLAVTDALLLAATFAMLAFPVMAERLDSFSAHQTAQYLQRWAYPVSQAAQTASVYLVVGVSAHRFVGICYPFLAQRRCTSGTVKVVIGSASLLPPPSRSLPAVALPAGTWLFALGYNVPRWIHLTVSPCFSQR